MLLETLHLHHGRQTSSGMYGEKMAEVQRGTHPEKPKTLKICTKISDQSHQIFIYLAEKQLQNIQVTVIFLIGGNLSTGKWVSMHGGTSWSGTSSTRVPNAQAQQPLVGVLGPGLLGYDKIASNDLISSDSVRKPEMWISVLQKYLLLLQAGRGPSRPSPQSTWTAEVLCDILRAAFATLQMQQRFAICDRPCLFSPTSFTATPTAAPQARD
jgi:hypothetical protein